MSERGQLQLLEASNSLGLNIQKHIPAFLKLYDLLTEANQVTNLTAIRDEEGIVIKHFIDSLTCLLFDGFQDAQKVIDIGTGAGFPGLPLAIVCPNIHFDLLDATQKKIGYLAGVIKALELMNATAIWGRSEELSREIVKRETYDLAVSRAVASLPVIFELALPLVKVGGHLLVQKGPEVEEELERGQKAAELLGAEIQTNRWLQLPITKDTRCIVVVRKKETTDSKYPRKTGVPAKNPLF